MGDGHDTTGNRVNSPGAGRVRGWVRHQLEDRDHPGGRALDAGLLTLNLGFITILVVETYPVAEAYRSPLWTLEVGLASVFLGEYLLRLYGARDRGAALRDPYNVVDLLTLLPTLLLVLSGLVPVWLLVLAELGRYFRFLRLFRFTRDRHFPFGRVSERFRRGLRIWLSIFAVLFVHTGLIYAFEHPVNPAFRTFEDAYYYTVVALSTVGFGDVVPVTRAGRRLTVWAVLVVLIVVPWQVSRTVENWEQEKETNVSCGTCGLSGHEPDASHCRRCGTVLFCEPEPRG
jgi:voltage-gated potassium channel